MIRDKIVFSVTEKLLREPNWTLQKAIDICRASEIAKERINNGISEKESGRLNLCRHSKLLIVCLLGPFNAHR